MDKNDDDNVVTLQYKTSSHLQTRISLHDRFSEKPYPWHRWVFEQFELPTTCTILEIGAGSGELWSQNYDRIPVDWRLVLSDQSPLMVEQIRNNLQKLRNSVTFQTANVLALPFADKSFDVVIANHMLYHVKPLSIALAEIVRILRPGGVFYAATNGVNHMSQLTKLVSQ